MEQWKQIVVDDVTYDYEVSSYGNVRNVETGRILKQCDNKGYLRVGLCKNKKQKTFSVHRLVAIMFIPNPNNLPQVNHKDENKHNNHVDNLEWMTQENNLKYGTRTERTRKKVKCIETGQIFDSVRKACEWAEITGGIVECCKGKGKTAGGYHWEYVDSVD